MGAGFLVHHSMHNTHPSKSSFLEGFQIFVIHTIRSFGTFELFLQQSFRFPCDPLLPPQSSHDPRRQEKVQTDHHARSLFMSSMSALFSGDNNAMDEFHMAFCHSQSGGPCYHTLTWALTSTFAMLEQLTDDFQLAIETRHCRGYFSHIHCGHSHPSRCSGANARTIST